jgi:ribosomal protein S18 acetylase RimI-like enzyme
LDDDALRKDCDENLVKTFESVASMVPGGAFKKVGGVTLVRTGIPGFNMAFALEGPFSLVEASRAAGRLYAQDEFPWSLVTTASTSRAMGPMIREYKLAKPLVEPCMVLSPIPLRCPPPPEKLDIRRVEGRDELLTFSRTGAASFGMPAANLDVLADGLAKGIRDGSFCGGCYLGYYDGEPVATSLRYTSGRVAGVYFVATAKEYRRRGIGEAMTWKAAVEGRKEECVISVLQASEMGRPVYEGMGYRTVATYQIWRPSAPGS